MTMRFISTRKGGPAVSLSEAIRNGAAPDGGLYLPDVIPTAELGYLDPAAPLAEFASRLLAPFFASDALQQQLPSICAETFDFAVPLVVPDPAKPGVRALELFHGPTGAFKDFGARFLMACFDRVGDPDKPLTVLAATSGDTGGAVGCAVEGRKAVNALILYPRGRVSGFQELQLTCWDDRVRALEVDGDFDDCQRLAKAAFADRALVEAGSLTSANSINLGRLLPQMVYLARAALAVANETGREPGLIVPSGNLGHVFAAIYARAMGLPIGPIIAATNANATLFDWYRSGEYRPRASIATIANAMDVGAPSNFERLVELPSAQRDVRVELVDDDAIRARITKDHASSGYVWCPHSATAAEAYARLDQREQGERCWIAAATAHPFKFAPVIEPLIGAPVAAPDRLRDILRRPTRKETIPASLEALRRAINLPPEVAW